MQSKSVGQVFQRTNRRRRGRRSRGGTSEEIADQENLIQSPSASSKLSTSDQIDISFPSTSNSASNITIETIVTFLRAEGLAVQKYFNPKTNENFHRWTLQVEENDGKKSLSTYSCTISYFLVVNDFLERSVISYRGFPLKFKRTNPIIDSKSFVLKSTINTTKGPISTEKFSGYIDILTNRNPYKLTDLSTPLEQILLIECNKIIGISSFSHI